MHHTHFTRDPLQPRGKSRPPRRRRGARVRVGKVKAENPSRPSIRCSPTESIESQKIFSTLKSKGEEFTSTPRANTMYPGPSKYYFNDSAGFDDDGHDRRRDPRAGPSRQEYRPHYEEDEYGECGGEQNAQFDARCFVSRTLQTQSHAPHAYACRRPQPAPPHTHIQQMTWRSAATTTSSSSALRRERDRGRARSPPGGHATASPPREPSSTRKPSSLRRGGVETAIRANHLTRAVAAAAAGAGGGATEEEEVHGSSVLEAPCPRGEREAAAGVDWARACAPRDPSAVGLYKMNAVDP